MDEIGICTLILHVIKMDMIKKAIPAYNDEKD